jgi:hypothetical protein
MRLACQRACNILVVNPSFIACCGRFEICTMLDPGRGAVRGRAEISGVLDPNFIALPTPL